jgi:hypothetical protein
LTSIGGNDRVINKKTITFLEKLMSNTVKGSEVKNLPFFARFLEAQSPKAEDKTQPAYTLKFPSDWEEY